ncbi:MAG: hypothetical protein K0U41_07305, partial [Gammaproteobacteria bacterium]|nr:hypothetical protein [Gammaproteobacteria bacterium]
ATINLVVPNDTYVLPDFNAGSQFQYEVRLRRVVSGTPTDYWCGFINPVASNEKVGTYPFGVSFTATDRLGLLEQQVIVRENVVHDPSLIGYIGRALRQTGLELPIYVDSGIRTANGDLLTEARASAYSFYGEDIQEINSDATLKRSLNGSLESTNCRVFQSEAKWWVVNCSTHGSDTDVNTTYAQFVPDTGMTGRDPANLFPGDAGYIPTANIEEYRRATASDDGGATVTIPSLRYEVDGTSTEDLSVLDEDLNLSLRRPAGSIESRPIGLIQDVTHPNIDFGLGISGWTNGESLDQLAFSTDDFLTGDRSIITTRSRQIINDSNEIWFRSVSGYNVSRTSPINIRFDWMYLRFSGTFNTPWIPFTVYVDIPTPVTYRNVEYNEGSGFAEVVTTIDRIYWDFNDRKWIPGSSVFTPLQQNKDFKVLGIDTGINTGQSINIGGRLNTTDARNDDEGAWHEVSVDIDSIDTFVSRFNIPVAIPDNSVLNIDFFFPQANRNSNDKLTEQNTLGDFHTLIDNVTVTNEFTEAVEDPIYEYRQAFGTRTIDYEPRFIASGPSNFRQYLRNGSGVAYTATSLFSRGETISSGRSLEEIVTGQKLTDYKTRLRYFEGSLINRTLVPMSIHNKIRFNYVNYDDNAVCIINGGSFDVKQNVFDVAMYQPGFDAGNTLTSTDMFTPYNVELVSRRFPGRSSKIRYNLGVVIRGLLDGVVTSASISTNLMNNFIDIVGDPGDVIDKEIILAPASGFMTTGTPIIRPDGATTPRPSFTTFQADSDGVAVFDILSDRGTLVLPIQITIPEDDEFDELHIDVPIAVFTGNRIYTIAVTPSEARPNYTTIPNMFTYSNLPGTVINGFFVYIPNPGFNPGGTGNASADGNQDDDLVLGADSITDNQLRQPFTLTIPAAGGSAIITTTYTPVDSGAGVTTASLTITLSNANLTNASWVPTEPEVIVVNRNVDTEYTAYIRSSARFFWSDTDATNLQSALGITGVAASNISVVRVRPLDEELQLVFRINSASGGAITIAPTGAPTMDMFTLRLGLDVAGVENMTWSPSFIDRTFSAGNAANSGYDISDGIFLFQSSDPELGLTSANNLRFNVIPRQFIATPSLTREYAATILSEDENPHSASAALTLWIGRWNEAGIGISVGSNIAPGDTLSLTYNEAEEEDEEDDIAYYVYEGATTAATSSDIT